MQVFFFFSKYNNDKVNSTISSIKFMLYLPEDKKKISECFQEKLHIFFGTFSGIDAQNRSETTTGFFKE